MTPLPLHPITADYADLTDAEASAMRESLKANGLAVPIAVWRGQVVDGRHRAKFCQELGIEPRYDDISDRCSTEEEMRKHVAALNERRRARTTPLSTAEKQARIEAELKADPTRSDRAIAQGVGVSPTTVGGVRTKLEVKGDVSKVDTRTDTKGRKQPAKKSKWKQPTKKLKPAPAASQSIPAAAVSMSTQSTSHAPSPDKQEEPVQRQEAALVDRALALVEAMTIEQRLEFIARLKESSAPPGVMPNIPEFLDRRTSMRKPTCSSGLNTTTSL
jgi:ParB-like chromosome segregation protein Spo0J